MRRTITAVTRGKTSTAYAFHCSKRRTRKPNPTRHPHSGPKKRVCHSINADLHTFFAQPLFTHRTSEASHLVHLSHRLVVDGGGEQRLLFQPEVYEQDCHSPNLSRQDQQRGSTGGWRRDYTTTLFVRPCTIDHDEPGHFFCGFWRKAKLPAGYPSNNLCSIGKLLARTDPRRVSSFSA